MDIYCISGLGADWRAFQYLDLPNHNLVHLPWIDPKKDETLPEYAARLMQSIDTSKPYALMGMSFGGMLATEIVKQTTVLPKHTIMISSLDRALSLPLQLKLARFIGLNKIIPTRWLLKPNRLTAHFFGANTPKSKKLLYQILRDTDVYFLRWAMEAILNWKNDVVVPAVRIHGNRDLILPLSNTHGYHIIDGGHFIVVNKAGEVSEVIRKYLNA